ncbi:MAG TPA: cellulose binding domain-containing protein, partial [Candidatus Dormibacteraeota bacterium]|nr:cellulose binding domain-containing protein [Candidatus Dormibacteraeota bacterium]
MHPTLIVPGAARPGRLRRAVVVLLAVLLALGAAQAIRQVPAQAAGTGFWHTSGNLGIDLANVTVRYWYTADGTQAQNWACDYTPDGCANVHAKFVTLSPARTNADTYLEISFAGRTLNPTSATGD